MKRLLLILPFVLAACDRGVTEPRQSIISIASSMSAKGGSCTLANGNVASTGFDSLGYNRCAGVFNGPADGVDNVLDGAVWGDPIYAADHLVMKWNAAWDACNALGTEAACAGAWTNNEWNGKVPGGSGQVWKYKMKWVGPCGDDGATLPDGGYCIWGSYEVLMDQGYDPKFGPGHIWFAHAKPNGYGN